jgi:Glutamine synthetase adenylyltransferase
MNPHHLFIGGRWVHTSGDRVINVVSASTGDTSVPYRTVPRATSTGRSGPLVPHSTHRPAGPPGALNVARPP